MLKGLRGLVTAGTGGRGVVAPGGVLAEVALARSHLMKAARGELVEAHERVGLDRGAVVGDGVVFFFFFFYIMYSLLKYKNPCKALAMT